ncbi:uncharacterized protein [Vulpes vulpes]|uniref:Uncharacterized protein isoform X2 n=1 Tax=Vulpes vulpes TaxID=9627 RepID=A0ABM5ASU8_VULVU
MFPSAVTALTGAGRSRSPERAGRERARLGERESESARGARGERRRTGGGQALRGLRGVEAGPGVRESPAWGAESGRATPSPGRRRLAAGGGHGGRGAGARGGVRGRRWKPGRLASRGVKGKECTRSAGCGGGLGAGAEPHREAWNSWRVRGGVRARLRSTGSGKEAAQPEKARGALLGARVAPDWLENAARVRARHERSLGRGPDRSNPLPSQRLVRLAVSSARPARPEDVRSSGALGSRLRVAPHWTSLTSEAEHLQWGYLAFLPPAAPWFPGLLLHHHGLCLSMKILVNQREEHVPRP